MSRQELADAVNAYLFDQHRMRTTLDETYIGRLERGDIRWPTSRYREAFRVLLGAIDDAQLGFYIVRASSHGQPDAGVHSDGRNGGDTFSERASRIPWAAGSGLESIAAIAQRTLSVQGVDGDAIALADLAIADIVNRYEVEGPAALTHDAIGLRRQLETVRLADRTATHRKDLLRLAARVSGLLGYMAVNLSRFTHAHAYSAEAFALAREAGDHELLAWIRGTQSFNAYYQHLYGDAVSLAQDGLRYAANGPQAVRLLINCEARALAFLPGRGSDAEAAVAGAYRLSDRHSAPSGIGPCISLGIYSQGRLVANAITVYQTLGRPERALDLVCEIDSIVESSDSNWSRSLVGLDHAMTLLQTPHPEVEKAMALGSSAIDAAAQSPITSVVQRANALLVACDPWRHQSAVQEFRDKIQSLNAAQAGARLPA